MNTERFSQTDQMIDVMRVLTCTVRLTVCYYYVMYEFQNLSTLYILAECQGTLCSQQAPCLRFKCSQQDYNIQPTSTSTNTQPFCQTGQMIELCCEYLSARGI